MQEEHSCCLSMCRKHISYTSRKYASCRGPLFLLSDTMNVKYGHHLKISFPICFGTCYVQKWPISQFYTTSGYKHSTSTPLHSPSPMTLSHDQEWPSLVPRPVYTVHARAQYSVNLECLKNTCPIPCAFTIILYTHVFIL